VGHRVLVRQVFGTLGRGVLLDRRVLDPRRELDPYSLALLCCAAISAVLASSPLTTEHRVQDNAISTCFGLPLKYAIETVPHGPSSLGLFAEMLEVFAGGLSCGAAFIGLSYIMSPPNWFVRTLYWVAFALILCGNAFLLWMDVAYELGMWRSAMGWPRLGEETLPLNVVTPLALVFFFSAPFIRHSRRKSQREVN
jgi:hypothetical protein